MKSFKPNENFKYFTYWVCERMNIFWNRYFEFDEPYTNDLILRENKFTNVYRVLDRSSQYLVKEVIRDGKQRSNEEVLWRILLYKHFNLPTTWEYLTKTFGDVNLSVTTKEISDALTEYRIKQKTPTYSNAYMMTASFMKNEAIKRKYGIINSSSKHSAYLQIFQKEILNSSFFDDILNSQTFEEAFKRVRQIITVGDFLAYQYVQDFNYTNFMNLDDNSFNAAGPGTIRGIDKCFDVVGKTDYQEIVKWTQKNFEDLITLYNLQNKTTNEFNSLPNWLPTVPDISNCFCETDKYTRVLGITSDKIKETRTRMKGSFRENKNKIEYVFPEKWRVVL